MILVQTVFDVTLSAAIVWMACLSMAARSLFGCVVAFISFGLLMSLAWLRLGAPDVALAEAAVGAGVTGALLIAALRRMQRAAMRAGGDAES